MFQPDVEREKRLVSAENNNERQNQNASDTAAAQAENGITIMDLLRIIRKHVVSAIVTFVVVFAAVCAYTLLTPPKYTSTAQMFATFNTATADATQDTNYSNISSAGSYIANQIKSYPTLATTESVLQPVIDQLGLDASVSELAGELTVTNPEDTAFVNIEAQDKDPKQSAAIANAVAKSMKTVVEDSLYSSDSKSPVTLSVVQQAQEPVGPSSPKIVLNLSAGIAIGLILGIIVALVKDLFSTRIEEAFELQEYIDAPIMGRIPEDDLLKGDVPVIISKPSSPIAEEYRRIRTNLSFTAPVEGMNARLIVLSSTSPSEGKTTSSVNLAVALAENGAKVLLIDADLRHPSVADRLGLEGNAGLTHVLSGQAAVKDVVQRYWKPNLHIMPAGPKPPNASALLNSAIMKELIEQALTQYDYVLVDTSPLVVANDAFVFGAMGNGIVIVSGRDVTDKRDLREIAAQLDNLNLSVSGFIFNYAKDSKKVAYKGNYYYYDDDANTDGKKGKAAGKRPKQRSTARRAAVKR